MLNFLKLRFGLQAPEPQTPEPLNPKPCAAKVCCQGLRVRGLGCEAVNLQDLQGLGFRVLSSAQWIYMSLSY